jgi:hypothetical protein
MSSTGSPQVSSLRADDSFLGLYSCAQIFLPFKFFQSAIFVKLQLHVRVLLFRLPYVRFRSCAVASQSFAEVDTVTTTEVAQLCGFADQKCKISVVVTASASANDWMATAHEQN